MGELLNKYQEITNKKNSVIPAAEEPDKVKKTENWLLWKKNKAKHDEYNSLLRSVFAKFDLNADEWKAVLKDALGDNRAEEIANKAWTSYGFVSPIDTYLAGHKELLDELNEDEKNDYIYERNNVKANFLKKLAKEGKIPKEVLDQAWKNHYDRSVVLLNDDDHTAIVASVEKTLNKEKLDQVLSHLNSYKPVDELSDEEKLIYPFKETIDNIKKNIPLDVLKDEKKHQDYLHALDFAATHILEPKNDYQKAMDAEEKNAELIDRERKEEFISQNKEQFKNGKYNNLYKTVDFGGIDIQIVNEEKNKNFEDFKNEKIELSEKTKTGMKLILQKMEEMQLYSYSDSKTGESANKIYGFSKLMTKQNALKNALNAEVKNPDEIIKAGQEYEESWKEMEELFAIAKQYFSNDPTNVQQNLDSLRTKEIPFTFTRDYLTTAQINGLFLTHMTLVKNNISIDDYLKNPSGAVLNNGLNYFKENGFEGEAKELSFDRTLDLMFGLDLYKRSKDNFVGNSPRAEINRTLECSNYLEADKELQNKNTVYIRYLRDHIQTIQDREEAKYAFFKAKPKNELERISRDLTLQNLLVVADEDRDTNILFGNHLITDINGQVIHEPFNLDRYIEEHDINYPNVLERLHTLEEKITRLKPNIINKDDVTEAFMNACNRILVAKQKERGKKGFDDFENYYLNAINNLTNEPAEADGERLGAIKQRLNKQLKDYKEKYRPDLMLSDLLSDVEAADRNVYNGSNQYKEAWGSVIELNKMVKEYNSLSSDFANTGKKKLLEQINEKIAEAQNKADTYIRYKLRNGKKIADLDAKPKRRVNTMMEANREYNLLSQWVFNTQQEIERTEQSREQLKEEASNEFPEAEVYDSDFDIYPDDYDFGGKTRSEQLDMIYTKLKQVDPKTLHSHQEFRNFRTAFEKFKNYGDKLGEVPSRKQMDEYLKLADDVKEKAKIYREKKQADKEDYKAKNNGRELEYNPKTLARIDFCTDIGDMIDSHLTLSSGKKYLKEVGGNPYERALGKWARIVRREDQYREDHMNVTKNYEYDKLSYTLDSRYYESVARGFYLEKIKIRFETDNLYSPEQFLEDMRPERIKAGAKEIKKMFKHTNQKEHFDRTTIHKARIVDYEDEMVEGVVRKGDYTHFIKADENLDYATVTENDLKDLRGTDQKYIRAEIKHFCSKLLRVDDGEQFEKRQDFKDFVKSFGFEATEDRKHLRYNVNYRGEPILQDVNPYVKTQTADYSSLTDEELSVKIKELEEKQKEYKKLSNLTSKNATKEELNAVTDYVKAKSKSGFVKKAEINLGMTKKPGDLNEAVNDEFRRRAGIYEDMHEEVTEELKKATEVAKNRKEEKDFYDNRRNTAENLKPGDILYAEEKGETRELEVVGVKNGMIYFDDFGAVRYNDSYTATLPGDRTYNKGGISIEDYVKNQDINYVKETRRQVGTKEFKTKPITGPIGREEFLEEKYNDQYKKLQARLDEARACIKAGKNYFDPLINRVINDMEKLKVSVAENEQKHFEEFKVNAAFAKLENDMLKSLAKKTVDDRYAGEMNPMKDYPTRLKQAMILYHGKDFILNDEIFDNKDNISEVDSDYDDSEVDISEIKINENNIEDDNEINDNKINDNKINDNKINDNIINDEPKSFKSLKDAAEHKFGVIAKKLDDELFALIEKRNKFMKNPEKANNPEGLKKLNQLNLNIRDKAYGILFLDILDTKRLGKTIDDKQYIKFLDSVHDLKSHKEFEDTIDSIPGFRKTFELKIDSMKDTSDIYKSVRLKRDEAIAESTIKLDEEKIRKFTDKIAGRPNRIKKIQDEIAKKLNPNNEKPNPDKNNPGAEEPNGPGAKGGNNKDMKPKL